MDQVQALSRNRPCRVLTIAGSDSGGGAGIQADIKTIERLGGFSLTALTAVTAQNTLGVSGVWPLSAVAVQAQIQAVVSDLAPDSAKTGMLADQAVVLTVVEELRKLPQLPLVVDPVMVAKGGERLLAPDAEDAVRALLLPLAWVVTPNLAEATVLTGRPVETRDEQLRAAQDLVSMGARAALVKGGHGQGASVDDVLWDGHDATWFSGPRLATAHTHGTGCTLSAALATGLGQGLDLIAATDRAIRYVHAAIRHAPGFGMGHGPLGHQLGQEPLF